MKTYSKLLIFSLLIFVISACSKEKEVTPANNPMVGKWLATNLKSKVIIYGIPQTNEETIESSNIYYEFKTDNTFTGSTTFFTLDDPITNTPSPISGTYSISGSSLILVYTDPITKKSRTETYDFTATSSGLTWTITLDNYKKALADQLDSDLLAFLNIITSFNFTISLKKV